MNALMFLNLHNPLYASVEVNEHWFDQALVNNEELSKSLVYPNEEMILNPFKFPTAPMCFLKPYKTTTSGESEWLCYPSSTFRCLVPSAAEYQCSKCREQ